MRNMRLRFPGGKAKAFTMSYDDGVQQDVRLIEIMRKNGVKGTFNIGAGLFAEEGTVYPEGQVHRRMTLNECLKAYEGDDIEVAIHGYTHPFLESIPTATAVMEIIEDRKGLEDAFHTIIRGMAYPFGTYSDEVVDILRLSGVAYSRTVESRLNFNMPKDWLRLGATCHHRDPQLMTLCEQFVSGTVTRDPWLFYLWGHAYEFEGADNWYVIEEFLKAIGHKDDIWYATNIEIYDYVKASEKLIFSVDGTIAQNPTSTDVWMEVDGKIVLFPAGSAIRLS
ncbi:MAG: polysaccharide deacetylase family protein [Clostridia bacterium]|nr:polysaccharide deacetylase family protein [Clostridia bacterium]